MLSNKVRNFSSDITYCFSITMQMSGSGADRSGKIDGSLRVYGSAVALPHLSTAGNTLAGEQHGKSLDARQEAAQLLKLQAHYPAISERQF